MCGKYIRRCRAEHGLAEGQVIDVGGPMALAIPGESAPGATGLAALLATSIDLLTTGLGV